ncbi:hypothetical protein RirG_095860 [Rhizophagus irregularis DAOM 197198w]|uniref:Protein kinase domain-containing protein n=1 Tax=Rhizophagus irregularis (strain DAOM 197198w) TaxID=1432141 RepID=A0A015JIZ3_RHIIW|nr:hypothetical protein RirG_095860 [Rhizophagus irregularis DAOM 197198w]
MVILILMFHILKIVSLEKLAEGGFGIIMYKAILFDESHKVVALKRLKKSQKIVKSF